ncbi:hypothetical protein EDC96DRAFT_525188 [Choanephora cucurbitarum]|nr:hypothetical protein EDC96DRAFT_525188 [Choanephora cucurbitarum]
MNFSNCNNSVANITIAVTGYQFEAPKLLEGVDNVAVAHGYRNRDKLPVLAKLSHQPLRLEREYHIVQRLYKQSSFARNMLCRPLDKIKLANSDTIAFIYEDVENKLEKCQPYNNTPEFHNQDNSSHEAVQPYVPLKKFLDFAIQCCNCLEMIHKHQIVHGEIKLNAFLWSENKDSSVKIWNFGSSSSSVEQSLTSEGWRKTVHRNGASNFLQMLIYMSPEQTGRTTFQPDHRTDLYSLGITMWILLTHTLPFAHNSPMEIIHNVLNKKLPLVHTVCLDIPVIISMIIEKLTNKSPDERYTSAHGLREDLKECLKQLNRHNTIEPFPLGECDIDSVFTLPNNPCFGRTRELSLINKIIRRTAYMCGSHIRRRRFSSSGVTAVAAAVMSPLKLSASEETYKRTDRRVNHNRKRHTEIVAIYGNTGVGKSTLIRNVQQFARDYGYVAFAKFDRRQPTPYGCILRCLSLFLKNILAEPAREIERFRKMLKDQLGAETISQLPTLLVDNVPELASFLDQPSLQKMQGGNNLNSSGCECDMESGEIKMRFHSAFIEIFQVMVNFKFVTLFLEDLHQADEASIELLDSLISARLDFLVILSYKDTKVSNLITKLLCNDDSIVNYVKIENLNQTALMDLVRSTMHRLEEVDLVLLAPLVEFIYKRTNGNPFSACQLLMTLEKKNLIYFTWEKRRWEYNIQEIDKALLLEISNTGKDGDMDITFLVRRLKEQLPQDGRRFLKWASFFGNSFNFETVRNLMIENEDIEEEDNEEEEIEDCCLHEDMSVICQKFCQKDGRKQDCINGLQSTLQQGFIQASSYDNFRFTHDRYSQAATMLVPHDKKDEYHFRIASHFITKNYMDRFWVADHVIAAIHLIQRETTKSPYRRVLRQAGDKAFDSGAHKLAFDYYTAAHHLLAQNPWQDGPDSHYVETLHLYTRLAEIGWVTDHDNTRAYLQAIFKHAQSPIDRATAYKVQHRYRWSRMKSKESSSILLECLCELGLNDIKINLSEREREDLYNLTRKEVLKVGINNILKLPICEDRLIRTRFAIMEELCLWAFHSNDIQAMLAVGSQFVFRTLKDGTTPSAGVGFVFFGIASMQLFKAYSFGEQIGDIGVALTNSYGGNSESGRARFLYATFLSSWKRPFHQAIPIARLAMKQSLLGGDRIYATFAHLYTVVSSLMTGENVTDSLKEAKNCLEETDSLGETVGASIMATTVIRFILAAQGKTKLTEDAIFDDDEFQDKAFVQTARKLHGADAKIYLFYYSAMKTCALSFFHFDLAAFELSSQNLAMSEFLPGQRHTHLMFFYRCISMIRLIRDNKLERSYLKQVEATRGKLEEWAQHAHPDNLQMFIACIDAELANLNKDYLKAQKLFDLSIRQAQKGKWPVEVAVMHELAAEYYLQQDMPTVASALVERAVTNCRQLGIFGKAQQLEKRYAALLKEVTYYGQAKDASVQTDVNPATPKPESIHYLSVPEPYTPTSATDVSGQQQSSPEETLLTLDVVDLASILKSSQVISSEMNFELLMKQMLGIILENSGAESGVIVVKENTSFLIVGCGSQTNGCEIYNTPKQLSEEADSIITRISHYAIHAQESLFIVDVQQDSRFSDCTTQAKSCICTPIIHKSAIVGCIYIESAVGSLTSRHETVLRLLSQQIGISVTNALLFKSIQKVTYANVKMIENQKAALEEARKSKEAALHAMKLKADFLANMSHELRTPFSGFYGMISLLSETTLDAEQKDIVHTAKESCEMLLKIIDDLLNFSKLEAGKVTLDLGAVAIEEVIADTIEILSSLAARKGLELAYIVDNNVPDTVMADSSRLRQILTNLLGNAIKFTHFGGVVIKCHVDKEYDENEESIRLKFEVIDTGIGIRPEQQCQLFEPFSQVDGSTTRKYGGTGLGLSICLQLVRLMMGQIGVESQYEKGSNFWFTIVVNKEKIGNNKKSHTAALRSSLRKQTILLASENDLNAKMVCSFLSDFDIKRVKNMHHAVPQALQESHPVLVLDLPPKPSTSLAHQIQSVDDDPECKLHIVLLYTPSTEGHKLAAEATNSAAERRGKIVKMAKPVRRLKLLHLLNEVMDSQQQVAPKQNSKQPLNNHMSDYFKEEELSWYAKKPVLIAEDNMVAQKLLRKQLEKLGFIVESANNGEEAVNLWRERPPHYFCMGFFDHHMPKCDGVEATKRIRTYELGTGSRLPIVALTADIQASARQISVDAGMDGYLTKPLIPKDLATTLRILGPAIQKYYESSPVQTHYDTPISSAPSSPLSL